MLEINLDGQPPGVQSLWDEVGRLTAELPAGWVLVGGLMVQVWVLATSQGSFVAGVDADAVRLRVTTDIDVLGQARPPQAIPALHRALEAQAFVLGEPDLDGYSHRYERDGVIVDLLAPDGTGKPTELGNGQRTVGIPGGSQALGRTESVLVSTADQRFEILLPTLVASILLKARSLAVHRDPDAQREDLLTLLALLPDPRSAASEIRASEKKWLRRVEPRLFDGEPVVADAVRSAARSAFDLLVTA